MPCVVQPTTIPKNETTPLWRHGSIVREIRMTRIVQATMAALFMAGCGTAAAQDSLIGKYQGAAEVQRGRAGGGAPMLVISSVENGVVKGAATTYGRCAGEYPLEGRLEGDKLELKSTKAGRLPDCVIDYSLSVDGKRLTGTSSGVPISFQR
jgi:hypothetical protein